MLSHGQLDFVGITQGQTTFSLKAKTWSVPFFLLFFCVLRDVVASGQCQDDTDNQTC